MPYQVIIKRLGEAVEQPSKMFIQEGESLLAASDRCMNKQITVGCRGGGCGICRVKIIQGNYRSKVMSRAHISENDLQQGVVLACRVYPESDMQIVHESIKPVKKSLMSGAT